MPKASLYAQFSNQYNSPLPWFRWVILISHRIPQKPNSCALGWPIIISGKLVVEQGIFHQERLHDLINLGMARFCFFPSYNLQLRKWTCFDWNSPFNEERCIWSFNTFSIFFYALLGIGNFVITEKISQWMKGVFCDFAFGIGNIKSCLLVALRDQ